MDTLIVILIILLLVLIYMHKNLVYQPHREEVFYAYKSDNITRSDANEFMKRYGFQYSTKDELGSAFIDGAKWETPGFLSDDVAMHPTNLGLLKGKASGANIFGYKPDKKEARKILLKTCWQILPFNEKLWSQFSTPWDSLHGI